MDLDLYYVTNTITEFHVSLFHSKVGKKKSNCNSEVNYIKKCH